MKPPINSAIEPIKRPSMVQRCAVAFVLIAIATLALAFFEYRCYWDSILRLGSWQLGRLDRVLLFGSVFGKSLMVVSIPILAGITLQRWLGNGRLANSVFWFFVLLVPLAVLGYIATDVRVRVITGQSLEYYLRRAVNQNALQWGGDGKRYLLPLLLPVVGGGSMLGVFVLIRRRIESVIASIPLRIAMTMVVGTGVTSVGFSLTVIVFRGYADQPAALQRLHHQFPVQAYLFHPDRVATTGHAVFQTDVRQDFAPLGEALFQRSKQGKVLRHQDLNDAKLPILAERPNVVLLILESFRYDCVDPQLMPKLARRSQSGWVATRHLSGSNCSPQGSFALLYGQYAMCYDAVLNQQHEPVLCQLWRKSGYQTQLAASCVFDYRRMDEMFSPNTFDQFHQSAAASKDWPQTDMETLKIITDSLQSSDPAPKLAVGYLMSTHYDYQYPTDYEAISVPDELSAEAGETVYNETDRQIPEGISRKILLSRYQKSLRFMDDALDIFLESIDLSETIVVITGDHGESLYDDGVLSHGSRLSKIQTHTPMVILGKNVPVGESRQITSHVDLIPTLWRLCGGADLKSKSLDGRNLLEHSAATTGFLIHEYPDSWDVMIIRNDDKLLLNQSRTSPRLSILGFSGDDGLVDPSIQKTPSDVSVWAETFRTLNFQSHEPDSEK
ncbi:Sulfatase [Rubripirellula obstinata]|uniref:Sulfatase n=1 Tax=Rubripirellula obstinata TaxID=406547 RepID=A0A5B1CJN0_9BACT|nr:sulfatase-like hydrolase/transferase [Rubripirellula obstinata]KAA1260776.1 Sulfatase [Rubripirellula obstinata]